MKKLLFTLLFFPMVAFAQNDEAAIKQVINSAYIDGIQNRGNVEDIRKGFHPGFNMIRLVENDIRPLSIEEWIANNEKAQKENPTPLQKAEGKFISVDITGTNAVVKLELYRANKKMFTDYLVLYKFNEGWRIVSKTYFRHP
jgi:hypothetical protein